MNKEKRQNEPSKLMEPWALQELALKLLELLNRSTGKTDIIRSILAYIIEYTGIEAAGIRLREGDDFPYYETNGFSRDFIKSESRLCSYNNDGTIIQDAQGIVQLDCMCGRVISGNTGENREFFTAKGSFWSNNLEKLIASINDQVLLRTLRKRCLKEGYRSAALIPLHSEDEIIGMLQLNDRREDLFTPGIIDFFEGIGESIGIALKRKLAEEDLSNYRNILEKMIKKRTAELTSTAKKLKVKIAEHGRDEQELKRVSRSLNALTECMQAIINAKDEKNLLLQICSIIVKTGGYLLAWIGYADESEEKRVIPVAQVGYEEGYLEGITITYSDSEEGRGPTGRAVRAGAPSICRDILNDPQYAPWREQALKRGYASSMALPLKQDHKTFGALNIYSKDPDAFDDDEIKLLYELSENLSFGIISLRSREGQKSAEKEKNKVSKELELIFNTISIGITFIDRDYNFIMVNKKFLQMFSLAEEEVIGSRCRDVWKRSRCNSDNCTLEKILKEADSVEYEAKDITRDGREITCTINSVPYISSDGEIIGIIQYYIDVTEKRRIQREFMNVIGEERQRIGTDLHDIIGQNLTAIAFLVEALKQKMNNKSYDEAMGNIGQISQLINNATVQTRKITRMLIPVEMGKRGLHAAIEGIASSASEIFNVSCRLIQKGSFTVEDSHTATHLFYIAREAVNNSIKHGKAGNIIIYLTSDKTSLNMKIQDDGLGASGKLKDTGVGLKIMKYRAEMIGAEFYTGGSKEGGFIVEVRLKK